MAQLKAAGFKLSASHTGGGESTTIADDKIQNGETVTIDAGKNIKVAHTANMVSVATKDNVNFDSVTIGNSGVSLTGGGLNNGGKTIVGVAKGENDTDAVNVKQLQDALAAANVTITTQVDSNAPFAYVNANGETLIRQPDGTFYKANDSNKTSYNGDDVTIAALNPKAPQTTVATKVGNIAKGTKDNDAVNVSQLKDTVTILGGGAMIADSNDPAVPAGTLVAPTYKVVDASGKAVPNINDAKDIGTALTNLNSYINTGFDVQGNGITEGTVTPTEKINFVDGTNTKAVVSKETNGVTNITFDVNAQTLAETAQLPVVYTDADTGGKVYKHTDGSFYTQQNGAGTKIDPPKVIASMQDSAGSTTNPTRLANVDTGKNDKDAVNVSQLKGAATALGGNSTINPDGTFKAPEYTIAKTDGTNHTTVNNVGEALKNLNDEVIKPLAFAGDSGNNITRKLGSTVNVKGGADVNKLSDKNIGVVADGTDTLTVKLAKELTGLTSAQFGDTNGDHTTINQNGVTIANGPSVTKSGISAGNKTISNVADGVNDTDAVNVSQLNAAKTKVTSGDKSITVTPNVSTNTYDLAVNTDDATIVKDPTTGALKANTTQLAVADGKVTAPATTDVGKLATAGDIANAINNSGFTLTAGGANGSVVNPGDSVDLKNTDKNIVVSKTTGSNDINFDLAPTIKIGPSTGGSPIIINGTAGEITGLNANLPTTQNNTAAGQPSNATTAQTAPTNADTIKNNAATVGDVLNAGFNVQTNGTATDFVKAYDTINFADGTGTTIISETDGATTTFKVNVNAQTLAETAQLPVVYTKADGTKVYKVGDKFFDNKEGTGTEVLAKDIIASMQNADGTTATPTKLANIANGTVNQTSKDAVNGGQLFAQGEGVKNIIGGNTTYDSASGTYKNTDIGGTGKATIDEAIKASKNEVVAGKNVTVSSEKGANGQTIYTVATKDDVNFNSVTAGTGTNQVVLDDTGVKVGGNIYVSSTGLNANDKKVTNVADGAIAQDSKDAINGGQLFGEIDKLNANINAAKTEVKGTGLATVSKTQGTNGQDVYSVDVAKAAAPTVARGNVTVDAGDAGKVMTAGDVAKAINNSEKTSSVVAGSTSVTVTAQSEDTKGNTEYSVDLSAATKAQLAKEESVSAGNTNITVAKDGTNATGGDNYKVTLSNNLDLGVVGSVKAGNTTVNNGGVTITNADPAKNVSLTAGGLNNGGNKITNVANGTDDNDVVNVSQLNELKKIVTGGNTSANVTTKPADTGGATPAGTITTTVTNPDGTTTTTTEVNQTVVTSKDKGGKEYRLTTYNVEGQNTYVTNDVIQAIGKMNEQGIKFFHTNDGEVKPTIQGSNTVDSSASGAYATAIGYQADAQGENAIAFGKGSKATGKNSLAIGTGNIVTGENSGAIGDPSIINGSNSYSVGNNNTVTENNTFVLGNNVTQTVKDSVFLGDKSSSTGIHTTANGGNYTYAGANDANVAGVANSTTAPDTKPVGVVSVGTENGATRQIQNVAAGVVSPTSTDAINGSQLYDTHQAITNLAVQTNQRIGDVEDNANAGVSSAMAMASLPQAYIPGKSMLTGGVASYNGEGAVAVGLSKLSDNGRWVLKMSGSADTKGNAGASIGAGFHF